MKTENIYTEASKSGVYKRIKVDTNKCVYELTDNLKEEAIENADFIAPQLFEALVEGLKIKGFKEV